MNLEPINLDETLSDYCFGPDSTDERSERYVAALWRIYTENQCDLMIALIDEAIKNKEENDEY